MSAAKNLEELAKWSISDPLLKDREVELHDKLHTEIAKKGLSKEQLLGNPRLSLFPVIEQHFNFKLSGKVLDVGCGSGYFSAWVALNRDVEMVYALESSPSAVSLLIPENLKICGVREGLVLPVQGSFNRIPKLDYFDYIIALGALHHSSDLFATISELYKSLKPGGLLIAQEPTLDDLTNNSKYQEIYKSRAEHNDHFFRNCEYKTALNFAGFEIICFDYFENFVKPQSFSLRQSLSKLKSKIKKLVSISSDNKDYKVHINAERRLLIARKPDVEIEIPHVWKSLRS